MITKELILHYFLYKKGRLFWKNHPKPALVGKLACPGKKQGYYKVFTTVFGKRMFLQEHRLIWVYFNGLIPEDRDIDHINRIRDDNRIENLRLVTRSQNCMNAKGKLNKISSLPKNVYIDYVYKNNTKYRAQVVCRGKYYRVGCLDSIEQAVLEAEKLRKLYHGIYANSGNNLKDEQ